MSLVLTTKRNCLSIATAGTRYSVLGLLAPLAPTHGCIHRVFRSSFTGPRFWHGGVKLRRAEFRLCSNSSPSGNAGRAVIEHQASGTRFRRHSAPISRRLDIAAIAAGCVSGDRLPAGGAYPCLLAMLLSFLVGRVRSLLLLFSFALAAFLRSLGEFFEAVFALGVGLNRFGAASA